MSLLLDSSVVVASLDSDDPRHLACDRLLAAGGHRLYAHALSETFAVLTGGRLAQRLRPALAAQVIADSVLPFVSLVHLTGKETMSAIADADRRDTCFTQNSLQGRHAVRFDRDQQTAAGLRIAQQGALFIM